MTLLCQKDHLMTHQPPRFEDAVTLFNQRQFFECHEVLEDLWRPLSPGPEKQFLQGLLQIGVGFHHLLNNNYTGAKNLLRAGLEKLESVEADPQGYTPPIALSPIIKTSQYALKTVFELGSDRLHEFPDALFPIVQHRIQP